MGQNLEILHCNIKLSYGTNEWHKRVQHRMGNEISEFGITTAQRQTTDPSKVPGILTHNGPLAARSLVRSSCSHGRINCQPRNLDTREAVIAS